MLTVNIVFPACDKCLFVILSIDLLQYRNAFVYVYLLSFIFFCCDSQCLHWVQLWLRNSTPPSCHGCIQGEIVYVYWIFGLIKIYGVQTCFPLSLPQYNTQLFTCKTNRNRFHSSICQQQIFIAFYRERERERKFRAQNSRTESRL